MIRLARAVLLNFFIGFVSDLVLNYLSRQAYVPKPVKALEVYFKRKTIATEPLRTFITAVYAGLTIVVCLLLAMFLSYMVFGFAFPTHFKQLYKFIPLVFLVGYAADVLIYKTQLFGDTLNPYYKVTGAGLWGALAIIFSVLLSYSIIKLEY